MKVLVTGAAGNAGQAVIRLLAADGFTLRLAHVIRDARSEDVARLQVPGELPA